MYGPGIPGHSVCGCPGRAAGAKAVCQPEVFRGALHRGHTGRIAEAEVGISQGVPVCTVQEHPHRAAEAEAGSSWVVLECFTQGAR